ncbi:hypothetical protein B0I35DRAFT_455160 [Stachybotrys elegans]|uniref:FAD-binding domain-containing protein n=1 Tax=Stachybotrys elegans TaxID=80388 RepID=A0A8K0WJ40_9HYPO|nr:hypothetical protein B0I35DRAFT_455160 [Stachybotrys elegans]
MAESTVSPFRVVIVGAGPVGLFLAHALSRAGIDYVILEQHDAVVRHQGAGTLVYPQTIRLLDQLGLWEKAGDYLADMLYQSDLLVHNGREIKTSSLWEVIGKNHAYPMAAFSRMQLVALLYENLPEIDKETRIKTNVTVIDVESYDDRVKVFLRDGSAVDGSIVVGVDGVHSKTRQIMQRIAQSPPDTRPMLSTYRGLYGQLSSNAGLRPGTLYQSRAAGIVSQMMIGQNSGHFIVLRPVPNTAERRRYSEEERDDLAQELSEIMVAPGVPFKNIWQLTLKKTAVIVDQEEGYCDKWYDGRVAIASDAAHKLTSVTGWGLNMGIHSVTVLANELHSLLQSEPRPSTAAIDQAFMRYQQLRSRETNGLYDVGRAMIRTVTWETWSAWFFDRIINPWIGIDMIVDRFGKFIKRGQILSFVPFKDRLVQVPWENQPPSF